MKAGCEPGRLIRARHILPVTSPPIEDGAVLVRNGKIEWVGKWRDAPGGQPQDAGEVVIFPAFVNAHCHLDYTVMRGAILPPSSFAGWIARINDLKRTLGNADYVDSIEMGLRESQTAGTGTILNIESFPELLPLIGGTGPRVYWFLELLDIRSRLATDELVRGCLAFFEGNGLFGLSPHAPYSTSAGLYAAAADCCRARGMPLCTHLAETWEEYEMFVSGTGPLHDLLARIGRPAGDLGGASPVRRILGNGLLPHGAILAHMNCLDDGDWEIVRSRAGTFSVVHCPGCHAYFGRPPFPLGKFLEAGVNVCLGTDSLASNRSLSMFEEIRAVLRAHPWLPVPAALHMATRAGAAAVGGAFGAVEPGFAADLVAIPAEGDPHESIVRWQGAPIWISSGGRSGQETPDGDK